MKTFEIFIGYEPREREAYHALVWSIRTNVKGPYTDLKITPLILDELRDAGLYHREHRETHHSGSAQTQAFDVISNAPMSTEFAISRFLTPTLGSKDFALFMDCDMMVRADINELFEHASDAYAVQCVQHKHVPEESKKMDGQMQIAYPRKNWSSVMLFNRNHQGNKRLTLRDINTLPGRDLHNFCWLKDHEIGKLPKAWNHLVGVDDKMPNAKNVHFTLGIPTMKGYEDCEHSDEWWQYLETIGRARYLTPCPTV